MMWQQTTPTYHWFRTESKCFVKQLTPISERLGALLKLSWPQGPEWRSSQHVKYSLPLQETETEGGNTTLTLNTEAWKEHTSPPYSLTRTQSKSHNQRPSERLCALKVENWDIGNKLIWAYPYFLLLSHTQIFSNAFLIQTSVRTHTHTHTTPLIFPFGTCHFQFHMLCLMLILLQIWSLLTDFPCFNYYMSLLGLP